MGLKTLKDFTDLLIPLQEAYGQLETEYELQRAMLHGKHAENARLREALEAFIISDQNLRLDRARLISAMQRISDLGDSMEDEDDICVNAISIAKYALNPPHGD